MDYFMIILPTMSWSVLFLLYNSSFLNRSVPVLMNVIAARNSRFLFNLSISSLAKVSAFHVTEKPQRKNQATQHSAVLKMSENFVSDSVKR